jgi:hypothetical protein
MPEGHFRCEARYSVSRQALSMLAMFVCDDFMYSITLLNNVLFNINLVGRAETAIDNCEL